MEATRHEGAGEGGDAQGWRAAPAGSPPLRVAVSGASGLVGSRLTADLAAGGHDVVRLVRRTPAPGEVAWDPARGQIDAAALEGLDAFVHLSGESIGAGRWSDRRKAAILESRTRSSELVARALAGMERPPRALVSASAMGYYGPGGDEPFDESSPAGAGFLSDVCVAWEAALEPARAAGLRVVSLRFGTILAPSGGALARLLTPFRLGLGGPIAGGRQWMSWIALDDVVGAIQSAITDDRLNGPVNAVAPGAVTNAEFARTLGRVLRRPAVMPLPAFAVRLAFGEMGQALLIEGSRVTSQRLTECGYRFRYPDLESALRGVLGRLA